MEDPQRGSRVRVKVGLDKVNMDDLPDSYRKLNAVYPRTYFPVQMKDAPGQNVPSQRYFRDDTEIAEDDALVVGRTTVPAPSLDGERDIEVPKISRRGHRKEVMLNDLAYRLSWSQSRVFAGRILFLQQSRELGSPCAYSTPGRSQPSSRVDFKNLITPVPSLEHLCTFNFELLYIYFSCSRYTTILLQMSRPPYMNRKTTCVTETVSAAVSVRLTFIDNIH